MTRYMERHDGHFSLYYADGYAVLSVWPPAEGGKVVYADDVVNRMKILGIPRVPLSLVQDTIDRADGTPERLVEWPAGEDLSARIEISIDDAGETAGITLTRPKKGGGLPGIDELRGRLSDRGVVHGIDDTALQSIVEHPVYDTSVVVARHTPPVHGKPRIVEFSFETNVGKPFLVDETGRIDLRELKFIQQVHEGDVIARFIPAVEPVEGKTVTGEPLPALQAGAAMLVRTGNNTELSDDELEIRALVDGNAFVKGGTVHVEPIVVVDSVDYKTGNIDFEGTVQIKHGIADGFTVHAGGTLEIGESVGRVTISADRDLILKNGANGADEGVYTCGGDLYAKYIESATISCKGTCYITDAIMHSRVAVEKNLGLRGKHAGIIGGKTIVGGNVWCKKIGTISETPTEVTVGVSPVTILEYAELRETIEQLRDRLDDLDKIVRHFDAKLRSSQQVDDPETIVKVRTERENNARELESAEERSRELREIIVSSPKIRVVVEEQLYPRVTVRFGRTEYRTTGTGTDRTILKCIEGNIIEAGFNSADPPDFAALIGGDVEQA